jgi:hypothetical protein
MKAEDFDKKFDEDKADVIEDLDLSTARRLKAEAANKPLDGDAASGAH